MEKLSISFKFFGDTIIHHTVDGDPVHGDIIIMDVNKQIFKQVTHVSTLEETDNINRERALLLGTALRKIGFEIQKQAKHGSTRTMNINGRDIFYF